ncbi:Transcription factor mbp1 (MBF subunit p120) [Exophiala xenobiotica]|nr:Transcription factor mbp1 (MBF subunit p120) [Exophiala xenobiotica]KAK5533720.1 Transcription factor mbp1 [Chaetothyriales sp. CCFEE 6169]KAK5191988.1 Transcription factor mbp1 [Exophiala xenobiotica]KAK5205266.1 Transcription factor mbp1 [Exophiala xenobiotica]KAK5218957.1 Transcription factor mbp1 [Exophiala xenobiotica]
MTSNKDIYSATYSNVPVYELKIGNDHVMRRRSDEWVNATHVLKIAGFDKPARTRILEREVQKGVHEKIQGGYGKYQGTWIPLTEARALAEKHGVVARISAIFDFVPGDRSPPPAPKHTTAASNRPKQNKQAAAKKVAAQPVQPYQPVEAFEAASTQYNGATESREPSPETASFMADDDFLPLSQNSAASRKRKQRDFEEQMVTATDLDHTMYGDELLDYFVTAGDDPNNAHMTPPQPPPNFDVDRPIDNLGNNALHWACAMGAVQIARDLLARGANPKAPNGTGGETPLIRAVLFTNNYDKRTFPKIVQALSGTIVERDWHGATVFHHIAESARLRGKWSCARYYCEVLINKMQEMGSNYVRALLVSQDAKHDTALLCAIRNGCVKVATFLLNHCPEAGDIQNLKGETANEYLRALREKKESLQQPGSSPPRVGESYTAKQARRKRQKDSVSRAASLVLDKIGPLMDEGSFKLADMYDSQMTEKDTEISEAKQALSDFETQRHKIRQETFLLMAKAEDASKIPALRQDYETCLSEIHSLLEQKEHSTLQQEIFQQDQQANPQAFRFANPQPLSADEIRASLPWAIELNQQQAMRRYWVQEIAKLMGEAGTGEKVGKHRKLVAIATGMKEDQLDSMSEELLENLQASQGAAPQTPPAMMSGVQA